MKSEAECRTGKSLTRQQLEKRLEGIVPPDRAAEREAWKRWDSVAKPLRSLGVLEEAIASAAGIFGTWQVDFGKKAVVILCADNGIVEEGISQTGKEVTAVVTSNFTRGDSCVCLMAESAGAQVFPVDIGVEKELCGLGEKYPLIHKNVRRGTRNFLKEPALTEEETVQALEIGIDLVKDLKNQGYGLIATGEMGIGNTTTSSAVASVFLDRSVEEMTGRGAGLSGDGLNRKINAIRKAIEVNQPDPKDAIGVLAKVGGFDIAGMAGMFLGGAALGVPVVIDGFISCVAALIAQRICPLAGEYMIASHVSKEPAARLILEALGKEAVIHGEMCLGEGSGAVTLFPFLDMGIAVYDSMSTFEDIHVEQYEELV